MFCRLIIQYCFTPANGRGFVAAALRNPHLPHIIRLRAPWDIEPLAQPPGHIRCTRHFNKPTGLDGGQRVSLVLDGLAGANKIVVNGVVLGPAPPLASDDAITRFDITPLLAARNKIEIELAAAEAGDPLVRLGQVHLEIDETPS